MELLTITEAARHKNCTRRTIYDWLEKGIIDCEMRGQRQFVINDEKFKKALTQGGRPDRSIFQDYEERQKEMEIEIKTLKLAIAGLENRIKKIERAEQTSVRTAPKS